MSSQKEKQTNLNLPALLFSLALVLLLSAPAAALDRVSWDQLPYYLARQGVTLNQQLQLCDCPMGLQEDNPSRCVIQVIANTRYEWREFEFSDTQGSPKLAVYLVKPVKKALTTEEARVLLTASAGWLTEGAAPARSASQTPEFSLDLSGRGMTSPTNIRSSENRAPIPPEIIVRFPYNCIASLILRDGDHSYRATGFQIAPYCLLTAGHSVWWVDHFMDGILAAPATYRTDTGDQIFPFGIQSSLYLVTNRAFQQYSGDYFSQPTETDFGALMLESTFNGVATYMPLEFRPEGASIPTSIMITGYPLYVPDGSPVRNDNMYLAPGTAASHPGNWQLIDYNAFITDGNDGSPIFYQNSSGLIRTIGIATAGNSGVLLTTNNMDLISSWMDAPDFDYQYAYYVPYYHTSSNIWTGLALANPIDDTCHIKVEQFSDNGEFAGQRFIDLAPGGQYAFPCISDPGLPTGWIKVSSTIPLFGLALVGESGAMSTMFDMDLKDSLHTNFIFPHLASLTQEKWTSTVMVCNPNTQAAELTFIYHTMEGDISQPATTTIPANGSRAIEAGQLFGMDLNNGYLVLTSTQPVTAFLLYDNTAAGYHWKAGLSAVPIDYY